MGEPVFFVVFALAAAAIALGSWLARQRRAQALARLCAERGWRYVARDDSWVGRLAPYFPLFRAGDGGRRCDNVIRLRGRQAEFILMDYSYYEESTDSDGHRSRRTVRHAVATAELPGWLPNLRLGPETVLTRLTSAVGFTDIELESVEFNRRFRVQAKDRAHAFAILHPRAISHLLAQPYESWEMSGSALVLSRRGSWRPEEYGPAAVIAEAFIDLVPDYVWRQHSDDVPDSSEGAAR